MSGTEAGSPWSVEKDPARFGQAKLFQADFYESITCLQLCDLRLLRPAPPNHPPRPERTQIPNHPQKTPRKSPHCKTCGRPRKGHPLRACETADSSPKKTPTPARATPTSDLIDRLAELDLAERDRKDKRARHQSAQPRLLPSLPSISTATGELLESLKAPGLLDDDGSEYGGEDDYGKREIIIRWREVSSIPGNQGAGPISPESPNLLAEESIPIKKQHVGK
ncbi:hypothetical protein B0H17DRAFT_1180483 [Mycena rosella]|uniref:Uncharacterized protein n=1 Tax=Mycena rosella TaxID=1033263 RepID=A0AAD7GH40_MYCRO|nr:hypothetical protein B0H17DRAFT_1180483 [Mycena rosella]